MHRATPPTERPCGNVRLRWKRGGKSEPGRRWSERQRWPEVKLKAPVQTDLGRTMRAQFLTAVGQPLVAADRRPPVPALSEMLRRVHSGAVCRTDLHVVDGELPEPKLPLVPGHEIVGSVEEAGFDVKQFREGDRVGIRW